MKKLTKPGLVAVAMVLCVSGVAQAHDDARGCGLKTLRGSYVFAASGFNIVAGVNQPKAIVEVIDFNGDGTLSVPGGARSINGMTAPIPPGGVGDYTVEADCSGTLTFIGGPSFAIFMAPGGKTVWMIPDHSEHGLSGHGNKGIALNVATRPSHGREVRELAPLLFL